MGELPNSFGDRGARLIAAFIMLNTPLKYLNFHNVHITNLDIIRDALKYNTNLLAVSAEQFNLSCADIYKMCEQNYKRTAAHPAEDYKQICRKLKHGDNIWVIDSIYRNNM